MSAIASLSKHAKPVRYKCSLCKERGHKRKFCPTRTAPTAPTAATALTIADIEFEKMCKEIGMRVTKHPPLKKSNRRVSFAAEPTVIKVVKLHENREDREQLWWPAANRRIASIEKCQETFWKRDSLYRWTIEKDVWNLYAKTVLKSTTASTRPSTRASTLPHSYDRTLQPDRGLY